MIAEMDERLRFRLRTLLLDVLPQVESVCSDPQCGDSTWDHECGLGQTRPDEKLANIVLRAVEITVLDQALAIVHDWPDLFSSDSERERAEQLIAWVRDRKIVDRAVALCMAWKKAKQQPGFNPDVVAEIHRAGEALAAIVNERGLISDE